MTLSDIFNSISSLIGDGISGIKWWISFILNEVHILYIVGFVIVITILGGIRHHNNSKNWVKFAGKYDKDGIKTHDEHGNKIE